MDRSGIILVNKNTIQKSFDVIKDLRKILGIKKIGHTGTIDKDQSGLMVCLINNATKEVELLQSFLKEYIIEIIFGIDTDTEDIFGNIINKNIDVTIDDKKLNSVLNSFIKEYYQIPPMYSAKKINGQRLLEFAHKDIVLDRKPNKVNIYSIELINDDDIDFIINQNKAIYFQKTNIDKLNKENNYKLKKYYLQVSCSKGTYMRTLCKDIAKELGLYATMGSLVRIKNSNFDLADSNTIDEIKQKVDIKDYSFIKPCYYMKEKQIVSFGKFETIHLGHKKIFAKMKEEADKKNLESTVLIIDDDANNQKQKIFSFEQRYSFIKNIGIDNIKVLTLYDDIKKWSGEYFVDEILINQLKADTLIVGEDCSFGYKSNCKINELKIMCKKHNVEVMEVNKIKVIEIGEKINNSRVLLEHKNDDISSTLLNECYNEQDYDAIELLTNRIYKRG